MSQEHPIPTNPRFKNLIGQRFGRLKVISFAGSDKYGGSFFNCNCDCGNTKTIRSACLIRRKTESCGCKALEGNNYKHGRARTPSHGSWAGMILRCTDPDRKHAEHYIGRGIKVCKHWQRFENFFADMGERPAGMTLDRTNNDGHYSCGHCEECERNGWPLNCRWATQQQQCRNTRQNRMVTFGEKTVTLMEWSQLLNVRFGTLRTRLERGWSVERAFTASVQPHRSPQNH